MSVQNDDLKTQRNIYTRQEITPLVYELMLTVRDVKNTETVNSVYLNEANQNLEIYVFYEKEDFEIEDKIIKYFTDWEENYKYFPEIFIYPLDMIEDKRMSLPETAMEV